MKTSLLLTLALAASLPLVPRNLVAADDKKPKLGRYDDHGLQFDYDRKLKVKTEQNDKVLTLNLEGRRDLVLTIQLAELPLSGEAYAEAVLTGMRDGMSQSGSKVQPVEVVKRTIGGQERPGKAFRYKLLGSEFYYQAYGWDVTLGADQKRVLFVTIQYPPQKESSLKPLFDPVLDSLRWGPKK